jgi:hypothetical protein
MNRTKIALLSFAVTSWLFLFSAAPAQDAKASGPDETVAEVPELSQFHEVIYKIWHTAWPEKDVAMLVELLPEIRQGADTLAKAKLPGILRDKEPVWRENINQLLKIVADYSGAASPIDTAKLLDAAERLHGQYEKLVRVTRPALRELEDFHQVLYMIYHHYLPDKDEAKLASSVAELKQKMKVLGSATLPDRLRKKEPAFIAARATLAKSVDALDPSKAKGDFKAFSSQVERVHTDYQAVQGVFE